jgi:hypothetical protein
MRPEKSDPLLSLPCCKPLPDIKDQHYRHLSSVRVAMLETTATGWVVHDWTEGSVAPTREFRTIQAAITALEEVAVSHKRMANIDN